MFGQDSSLDERPPVHWPSTGGQVPLRVPDPAFPVGVALPPGADKRRLCPGRAFWPAGLHLFVWDFAWAGSASA